jgi:hypothetical protein
MQNSYIAYTTNVNGTLFYFVKRYLTFPENKDIPDILENYGMHTDFDRACAIAQVDDKVVREQLFHELQHIPQNSTVVPMHVAKVFTLYNNKTEIKNVQ